jgi:hypothetical protein
VISELRLTSQQEIYNSKQTYKKKTIQNEKITIKEAGERKKVEAI